MAARRERTPPAQLEACVLRRYDWSESSLILDLFSRERGRIAVVAKDGSPRGFLDVPDGPSNCAFGGGDGKTLFITTRSTVRSVPTLVEGAWVARASAKGVPATAAPDAGAPARTAP